MADFIITAPDGQKYKVSGENEAGAMAALKAQLESAPAKPVTPSQPNPDGTFGKVPEGMFLNPVTGQMTSREMLANNIHPGKALSALTGGAQGATFGLADEGVGAVSAMLPTGGTMGQRYEYGREYSRAQIDAARRDNPVTTIGSEIGGSMALPIGTAAQATTLPMRMAESGAKGAAMAGAYGFGAGEGGAHSRIVDALSSAKWGGAIGAALPVLGAGVQKISDTNAARSAIKEAAKNAPTSDQLRVMGNAAYKAVDDAGVQVDPSAYNRAAGGIIDDMRNLGMDQTGGALSLTPQSARMAEILSQTGQNRNGIPFAEIDQLRRKAAIPAGNFANKTEGALGSRVIGGLDELVNSLDNTNTVAGDASNISENIKTARDIWHRMSKSQKIDDAIAAGGNYLSGTGSGIRNQFKNLLNNKKAIRGFSDAEVAAIRRVANGSIPEKMLQLAGGGLGNIATVGGASAAGGVPGFALGALLAAGLRKASDKVTTSNAETARAIVANGTLKALPLASPTVRLLLEQLGRQGVAAGLQQ